LEFALMLRLNAGSEDQAVTGPREGLGCGVYERRGGARQLLESNGIAAWKHDNGNENAPPFFKWDGWEFSDSTHSKDVFRLDISQDLLRLIQWT
jgi:hypothetical protein